MMVTEIYQLIFLLDQIMASVIVTGEKGSIAIKSKNYYIFSGSFYNSSIPNSTAFVCHTLKCYLKLQQTQTLDKMVEKVLGSEKIGIEENQSVYKHFCNEISFDENDNKCKIKPPFK